MAVDRAADSTGLELGLSYLDRVIASGGDSVAMLRGAAEELSAAIDAWRPGGLSGSLVARPCPMSAARWHLEHLAAARGPESAVRRAQRIYHARMLGFLLVAAVQ